MKSEAVFSKEVLLDFAYTFGFLVYLTLFFENFCFLKYKTYAIFIKSVSEIRKFFDSKAFLYNEPSQFKISSVHYI